MTIYSKYISHSKFRHLNKMAEGKIGNREWFWLLANRLRTTTDISFLDIVSFFLTCNSVRFLPVKGEFFPALVVHSV